MIKLRRNHRHKKKDRFYLMQRMDSVSPDYIGLQVTFGPYHRRGRTYHYWFKKKTTPTGREVSPDKQLLRKVSSLVLQRLRNGYLVKRKCDSWCRHAVERSISKNSQPKRGAPATWKSKPKRREVKADLNQLSFDFDPPRRKSRGDTRQLSFDF